ncbi:uncharacterized protein LY89DRAFT_85967 [Mollisia scopiformis]|uniref:Uncharacterized protein n=1 Tax=Mollisia scopiformis TaxID=149040 RepID=A0A194X9T5_MOLSC|nr:uncharacterized protein LY89DRAFT_85967 [Mollisia scopiformis]KUJ16537.1 hypothetical protein LY89DRAFT_85967 [Mollisia scopiformis]
MSQAIRRHNTGLSTRSTRSGHSDDSHDSQSTTPTSLYSSPAPSMQAMYSKQQPDISPATTYYPRSSTETYSSTVESLEELCEEPESYDPEYQVPEYREVIDENIRASNPSDFAEYFPSTKRLTICHDTTTHDANWNLRVDGEDRKKRPIQLFHLKMNDLSKREFSLRRYERASGREVCHSCRKNKPVVEKRPTEKLTRSMSTAFASIKPEFKRTNSGLSSHSRKNMKRQDSGYVSSDDYEPDFEEFMNKAKAVQIPTNTTKLEFSNYAQVEVKRRGAKSTKRYEFEYWGHDYVWKRVTKKDGSGKEVSYHLYKDEGGPAVAHIVPELRSPAQIEDEERNGGWVPPSSLWISDKSITGEALTDVAEVIVATGLIALVDDCIKRHFHPRPVHKTHHVPATKYEMEFVNPRTMVSNMFKRRNSGGSSKSEQSQRSSPLRYQSPVAAY